MPFLQHMLPSLCCDFERDRTSGEPAKGQNFLCYILVYLYVEKRGEWPDLLLFYVGIGTLFNESSL